ncbi:MAG: DUF1214 domain-containing protein [Deltaproteobacteria bacterium]
MGSEYETGKAFNELLDTVRSFEGHFLAGPNAVTAQADVLDGYVWATTMLRVGLDVYLWADPLRPEFKNILSPTKRWGGDNADAHYMLAAIDGEHSYRIRGRRGDACYLSITVYGGPRNGDYGAQHTVATLNHRDMEIEADGSFEIVLGGEKQEGNWLGLSDDSVFVITRDYMTDSVNGRRTEWVIEAVETAPPPRSNDAEMAARFRAVARFLKDQLSFQPIPLPPANTMQDPVPAQTTFGWPAGDAIYAMGSFDLADDEALVIKGHSPQCAFWNVCLWNPFLHSYDYRSERVTLNTAQCSYADDGSWTIVISPEDPGHPNWISTAGRRSGLVWFRWFLVDELPAPLETEVVALSSAGLQSR